MQYDRLPCDDRWKSIADAMMRAGQVEGMIPADREPLNGGEEMFLARQATHDGFLNAGIAVFYPPENYQGLWLDILYVSPEFHRRGIARTLVALVRQEAVDGGHEQFGFGTILHNKPMLSLAASLGLSGGAVYFDQPLSGAGS